MTRPRARRFAAFAVFVVASLVPLGAAAPRGLVAPTPAPSSALLDILQAELNRNVEVLRQQPTPPYFVSYSVYDTQSTQVEASFGAVVADIDNHARTFGADVRTGSYALDNTHELRGEGAQPAALGRAVIPLTDSAPAVDVAAWQATDRAYRQAVERLARVKTNLEAKVREEDPAPDFSREPPQVLVGRPATYQLDKAAWEARLRRVSAVFAEDPRILRGEAALSIEATTRYMVSTEGTRLLTGDLACRLSIQAQTKADDGMDLPLYQTYFARSLSELPSEARLLADARQMAAMLARLQTAPVVDPYTGPAILSGRAAGVFFHEIFGHRIEGSRQKTADDAQTFSKKVGEPVLPPFLSVVSDPTMLKLGNTELSGSYQFDDEGVRAERVSVVERGILREFLLGRSPLARFPHSNGHGRAQPGFRPISRQSNLIVESSAGIPFPQLVERLKEEARKEGKPFGLLFDQVEGGFTYTARYSPNAFNVLPLVVYRVYTDNRPMELVRGVDLIGTPLSAFNRIVATDDHPQTFNGICGAESGSVPVSATSPALLVSEVEVQKAAKSDDTLPILPAPPVKVASEPGPPVLDALGDELARSMSGLKLKDESAPYFMSYTVSDFTNTGYHAMLGALVDDRSTHMRLFRADVRVGSYAFDSSRFFASGLGGAMASIGLLPVDDNAAAIRRAAWLTTDAAYKNAVQTFARKKAAFANRSDPDPVPDFSKAPATDLVEAPRPAPLPAPPEWKGIVEEISRTLGVPAAVSSDVALDLNDGTRYFVNSEGTRIELPARVASFRAAVTVLGDDGMPVSGSVSLAARPEDLPGRADLLARARQMLDDVMTTRTAKLGEDYSGPVLVEGDAAVSLVSQSLVPLFLARRPVDSDRPGRGSASISPYLSRIGNRVLPESFTVTDTPSVTRLLGQPAGGAYLVDDEGVKAQDVTLVKDGRLLTLLTSRTPQRNLTASDGHMRGSGPQAGVFQVECGEGLSQADLKAKYLDLLETEGRRFGYIVRRLGSPARDGLTVVAAVRVTPDGREEPVRGLLLGTPTHTAFRDITAASKERTVTTELAPGGGPMGAATMVTVAAPSLIFEELDLEQNKEPLQKRPLVPSPLGAIK